MDQTEKQVDQDRNRKLNQGDFSHLVNPSDPMEVQREQETKPARTVSGPGETSVAKDSAGKAGGHATGNHDEPAAP
jgi:hypothetical protein